MKPQRNVPPKSHSLYEVESIFIVVLVVYCYQFIIQAFNQNSQSLAICKMIKYIIACGFEELNTSLSVSFHKHLLEAVLPQQQHLH